MLSYIKKKIEKMKAKTTLHEYGFQLKSFNLSEDGQVDYAQWLHPYEKPKVISQSMVNFYKKYSKKGSLVVDIGAHTGDTTVPMAIAVGKEGTVIALEPNSYVFKILKKNSELNPDKSRIIPFNFAATENDGEFEFNYSDASFCNGGFFQKIQNQNHGHKHILKVKGKNLENFLEENYMSILNSISLVKIDAEGYDKEIIKNLRPLLVKYKPNIISECNKNLTTQERTELYELLHGMEYNLYKLDEFDENYSTTLIENATDMTKWNHFDVIAISK